MADLTLKDLDIGGAAPESTVAQAAPATPGISAADLDIGGPTAPTNPPMAPSPAKAESPPFDVGKLVQDTAKDFVEGAAAPFTGTYHGIRAILADPSVRVLPTSIQDEEMRLSEEQGWKGAAFWSSMLAGGGAANLAKGMLLKGVMAGGAGAATFEAMRDLPEVIHQQMTPQQAAKDVGTLAAFGALTGGAMAVAPAAARGTAKGTMVVANKAIDTIPGGPKLRVAMTKWADVAYRNVWDRMFTSGDEYLRKVGLHDVADKLMHARGSSALIAGGWVANHKKDFAGLGKDEVRQVAGALQEMAIGKAPQGYSEKIMQVAMNERERMRAVGRLMENTGMRVYDPERGLHVFVMRKDFDFPHRFVNPTAFEEGGVARDEAIAKVMLHEGLAKEDAVAWVDNFAMRLRADLEGVFTGQGQFSGGTGTYMLGRRLSLPGFSEDIDQILPQYYEHAARKLGAHLMFGPGDAVEASVFKATKTAGEVTRPKVDAEKALEIGQELEQPIEKLTPGQIIYRRKLREQAATDRKMGVEFRYPRAFAPLERIPDVGARKVAENIIRRQLGAIETPSAEIGTLTQKAMFVETITKLALGAIAQPSQILSGGVRTNLRSGLVGFMRTLANMPGAYDFGLRTGAILPSIVRESEETLTGKMGTGFLKKVGFSGADTFVRVVNAMQGASFAEQQAGKLAMLSRQEVTPIVQRQMANIERKLMQLGLDPRAIVGRGGTLNETELLKAGQHVAGDVSFWGDSLSLPEFWKSNPGRFLTQFKSFAFQQSKMIKDYVIKPAMKGDLGPLARFAILAPSGGLVISQVKQAIRMRKPQERNAAEALMDATANGAGFGIMYDAFSATKYGTGGVLGFMAGPHIGGTITKGWLAAGQALRGDPRMLERYLIETGLPVTTAVIAPRALPAVAVATPALANALVPPKQTP